jgi:hypothetical protein
MRHALLFVCIGCITIQSIRAQRTVTGSPHIRLPHPQRADPAQDCRSAIAHHDLRFVGVAGFALDVPGVPDYFDRYWKSNGVKVIAGTSDASNHAFNVSARTYARRYNEQLLKHLSTHRSSNAKT